MRILVTGATGVVGRRLVPLLRRAGHDVTGVARSPNGRAELERHGARAINLDLFDAPAVRHAVEGQDAVINLATHIPPTMQMLLPWAWRENDRLRGQASGVIAGACLAADVPRFIQESFAPAYMDCGDRWIDETTPTRAVRHTRTVADAEAAADRVSQSGRTGIVLRFGAFYGPDARQTVDMIGLVRKGWAPLPGPPHAYISSVSHDDAATAAAAAVTLPPGAYNVVDDQPVTHQEFVDSLADAVGVPHPRLPPRWVASLFGSLGEMFSRSLRMSNRKFRAASGWSPKYPSVRDGWPAVLAELGHTSNGADLLAPNKTTRT